MIKTFLSILLIQIGLIVIPGSAIGWANDAYLYAIKASLNSSQLSRDEYLERYVPSDARTLIKMKFGSERNIPFYVSDQDIQRGGILLSPIGDALALNLIWKESVSDPIQIHRRFRAIDTSGTVLFDADLEVIHSAWHPDGSKIAVATGQHQPESDIGYFIERLGIIDLADSSIDWVVIDDLSSDGLEASFVSINRWMRDIFWASDNSLYAVGYGFLHKFDFDARKLVKTLVPGVEHKGKMQISPDGRFALWGPATYNNKAGRGLDVYEIETGKSFGELFTSPLGRPASYDYFNPIGAKWFGDEGALLVVSAAPRYKRHDQMTPEEKKSGKKIKMFEAQSTLKIFDINAGRVVYEETPPRTSFDTHPWKTTPGSYLVTENKKIMVFPKEELFPALK